MYWLESCDYKTYKQHTEVVDIWRLVCQYINHHCHTTIKQETWIKRKHGVEWNRQLDRSPSSKFILNVYNFQQRMSWLPQRWRTQRNAIRNANCRTSWIIKILNAHCASRICLVACKTECPCTPLDCYALICTNMSEYDIAMGKPWLYWSFVWASRQGTNTYTSFGAVFFLLLV